MKRVVITGMGTVNSLGNSTDEFWNNLKAGKLGFSFADNKFDISDFDVKIVSQKNGQIYSVCPQSRN